MKTPYRKIGKYTFPFFFFIVLYLINYILNISFVLFRHFPKGGDLAFAYLVIGFIVAVLFVISSVKKPGYIDSEKDQNTFTMLKRNHPSKICFECMVHFFIFSWSSHKDQGIAKYAIDASVSMITIAHG